MAFSFVQSKSATGNSTTAAVTLTNSPANGNLLAVGIYSAVASLPTNASGYTVISSATATTVDVSMWFKFALAGESTALSFTVGSGLWAIAVAEYNVLQFGQTMVWPGSGVVFPTGISLGNPAQINYGFNTMSPKSAGELLIVGFCGSALASAVYTGLTINGLATNKRENTASASACNCAIFELISEGNPTGQYTGAATSVAGSSVINGTSLGAFVAQIPINIQAFERVRAAGTAGISVTEIGGLR